MDEQKLKRELRRIAGRLALLEAQDRLEDAFVIAHLRARMAGLKAELRDARRERAA